jgi:predicted ATP pyrophosphatase (TIGR00289 family)
MFHYPNVHVTEEQSASMGIPRVLVDTSGDELDDLSRGLVLIRRQYGVDGVVTGALLSDYQRMMMSIAAKDAGLRIYSPLWRKDQYNYMQSLVRHGFIFIITSISTYGLPPSFLGRVVDLELVEEILGLARRFNFNPAFEGGEAETLVLDAPLFRYRLRIIDAEIVRTGAYSWIYLVKGVGREDKD